eukprot:608367-Prorocentrum_minimum.AAC.1
MQAIYVLTLRFVVLRKFLELGDNTGKLADTWCFEALWETTVDPQDAFPIITVRSHSRRIVTVRSHNRRIVAVRSHSHQIVA